ncbi:MAG: alpha/beta fold hydrolase [Proteobacteria bacterium]|nr:alpha/beta fold hydrolase [Pseudomonadota bacterium]
MTSATRTVPGRRLRVTLILVAVVCCAWLALVAGIWATQEQILFHPEPLRAADVPLIDGVTEEWVEVAGARLHAFHYRQPHDASGRPPRGLVFYLHGNAGNVASWFVNPAFWRESGFDVFLLDYRGFGRSSGRIENEAQLVDDVSAAWAQVAPEYHDRRLVIFGRSLGTGLAVRLAATAHPDLLVLVSPYTSMAALKDLHYPWVPDVALRYPLRSDRSIAGYRGRLLVFAGLQDAVVPPAQSRAIASLVPGAEFVGLDAADHHDIHEFPEYRQRLLERLSDL